MKQIILSTLLIAMTISAQARFDKDRGGGNGVNDQLFDFYENSGTEEVDLERHAVFQNYVVPVLKEIEARVPEFVPVLMSSLKSKHWYLEPKEIENEGCINNTMIKSEKVILACQSEFEVRMDLSWVEAMAKKDPKQVAGLFMHEMLVALQMKDSRRISEESVRFVNRRLFTGSMPAAEVLQETLKKRGFGNYSTASEIAHAKAEVELTYRDFTKLCPSPNKTLVNSEFLSFQNSLFVGARDGRNTRATQAAFLKLGQALQKKFESGWSLKCSDYLPIFNSFTN